MEFHVYPGAKEKDTTFNNIQSAYDAMSQRYLSGEFEAPARILVHKGTYHISKPLHFYDKFPVTIEAFEKDKVIISGATEITGWKACRINGVSALKTVLSPEIKEVPFFYVDGKLMQPARYPKKGYFRVTDERIAFRTEKDNYDNFHYAEGDFNPDWYDIQNITVNMIHLWIGEFLKIESVDTKEKKIVSQYAIHYCPRSENTEYCYTNVREALSEPGEYYFDRNTHELIYIPLKKKFTAEIPAIGTLVRFDSDVQWVTLKGISFCGGGNYMPIYGSGPLNQPSCDLRDKGFANPEFIPGLSIAPWDKPYYASVQGATHLPGVLYFDHASDCVLEDCEISACSWYGIMAREACTRLTFKNNHIHDMGGGGFILVGPSFAGEQSDPSLQVSKNIIKGNHIHDCGQFYPASIGVLAMSTWGNLIEDNHIHDLYYSGISCGWNWGYANSAVRENRIHRNHIHHLGKEILSDMGGIYLLGIQPGTRVWENTIHHISSRYYGGWGLYTDEGSSHIVLERNVVYKCNRSGYHQHYGRENIVRWNIFAFNGECGLGVSADHYKKYAIPGPKHSKTISFINNVIIMDGEVPVHIALEGIFTEKKVYLDGNIYYDISNKLPKKFASHGIADNTDKAYLTMKQWQKEGYDRHSIFADPGFVDAENFDFRLKKDSILRDYGFEDTVEPVK